MSNKLKFGFKNPLFLAFIFLFLAISLANAQEGVSFANGLWSRDENGAIKAWVYSRQNDKFEIANEANGDTLIECLSTQASNNYLLEKDVDEKLYKLWPVNLLDKTASVFWKMKPLYIGNEREFTKDEAEEVNKILEKYASKIVDEAFYSTDEFEEIYLNVQKEIIQKFGTKYLDKGTLIFGVRR